MSYENPIAMFITCGISLFTNFIKNLPKMKNPEIIDCFNKNILFQLEQDNIQNKFRIDNSKLFSLIHKTANYSTEKMERQENTELKQQLDDLFRATKIWLNSLSIEETTKVSAELNSLFKYFKGVLADNTKGSIYYLISTDTYQGEAVAKILKSWLEENRLACQIETIKSLRTSNVSDFTSGIHNLIKFCNETVKGYMPSHHVVFNLVGGFKTLQGYMQVLGMFYAAESIYVFESGDELLRIPRIPVDVEQSAKRVIENNLPFFRRLACKLFLPDNELPENIPETLYEKHEEGDGNIIISYSPWGEVIWSITRDELYKQNLLDPFVEKIEYGPRFKSSVLDNNNYRQRLLDINNKIDDLHSYLYSERKNNPKSLSYKKLTNLLVDNISTHEFYLWSDGAADRVYCHEENGKIILDKAGKHL